MCGICGFLEWNKNEPGDIDLLNRMNRALTHRGPDDEGTFISSFGGDGGPAGHVGLAMRRLSIIDLSTGHQPMFNETNDVVVVYNGETYNFHELRDALQSRGHVFKTTSDTEILVHGYEEWGESLPEKLNGMFGFAVWDMKKKKFLLARDRMGIKPVYYALSHNRLVFGSEIKAILEDPSVSQDIDPFALNDYLSMRCVPTPQSIYKSIRKLEPGAMLIWEKGSVRTKTYWQFDPAETKDLGLSHYLEKLDFLLDDAVKRQLVSDVPLGTFLSGGLDSPTISYFAKKHKPDLMSFNIYFADKTFSEREGATMAANALGLRHIESEVTPDIHDIIPRLVDIFDEPFGDDSMIPTYFLTKMAREHMTVALSGDGGDELFGGYPTYIADRLASVYRAIPKAVTRGLVEPFVDLLPVSFNRISLDYKAKAFIGAARRQSPLEHFGWTEIFRTEVKENLYSESFKKTVHDQPLASAYVQAFLGAGSRKGLERFLYVDQKTHLLDEFLVKVDRLSMAHSLEVRPPFLDHRLVEFAATIPMSYKIKGWTTKWLLRRLMKGRLPEGIIRGAKKGFSPPTATWLVTDLRAYAERKFSPGHLKDIPFLNPAFPSLLFEQHKKRQSNLGRRLWTLLMLIEWYDRKVLKRS